jgi:hypothetical protein
VGILIFGVFHQLGQNLLHAPNLLYLRAIVKFGAALHIEEIKTCPLIEAFD